MGHGDQRLDIPTKREETKNAQVWKEHYVAMLPYARRLVGDADAEDIVITAILDAFASERQRPPIDSNEMRALLLHLVWLRAREFWRNRQRWLARMSQEQDLETETSKFVLDKRAEFVLDRFALERALCALDQLDQHLVWGHCVDDFTVPELARIFGMNERTAGSRITRSLQKLRMVLNGKQRKTRSRSLRWFCVDFGFFRSSKDQVAVKLRSWFAKVVKFGQAMVPSVASVAGLAFIPSDGVEFPHGPEVEPPSREELVVPSWEGVVRPWVSMNTTSAHMDAARPETNPVVPDAAARTAARPQALERQDEPILPNEPVVSSKPPAPMVVSEANRCDNAFSQAMALWQIEERAECLAILDQHRRGPNACPETPPWSNLRRYCQSAPAKLPK